MSCLDIVTPFSANSFDVLAKIYESIVDIPIKWNWYIISDHNVNLNFKDVQTTFDNTKMYKLPFGVKSGWGKNQVNMYLDMTDDVSTNWVYVLDDDNIIHPNFYNFDFDRQEGFVVFEQQLVNGNVRRITTPSETCAVFKIDQAQMIHRRNFIGDLRYWAHYRGDGYFAMESFYKSNNVGMDKNVRSYYNFLKW